MAAMGYRALEDHIIKKMSEVSKVKFRNWEYKVLGACKPSTNKGECKTDVYVSMKNISTGDPAALKLSVKLKDTNEFQENKVTAKRAEEYFGEDWEEIIQEAALSIKDSFESRKLLFPKRKGRIKKNSITLGWKLEITNKRRELSVKAPLTEQQIRDYVYKGTNQSKSKRDAYVFGKAIPNSGVANFIIETDISEIKCAQDVVDRMVLIDNFDPGNTYLAFTANNYRTDEKKADGERALAVCIRWECKNGKLTPDFIYDEPLKNTGGGDMAPLVRTALAKLGKRNIKDIVPGEDLVDGGIFCY